MFGIFVNKHTDKNMFAAFVIHCERINIPLYVYISDETNIQIDAKYITTEKNIIDKCLILTEYDYIFAYEREDTTDTMILSYNINITELNKPAIIGRVFLVPVDNEEKYTTFEIPDFILYKHANHTNYTIDGIVSNNGVKVSDNIVCFSMKTSKVAMNTEYYKNDILVGGSTCENIYMRYAGNVYINKEFSYGIIWHAKCGCTSICKYFCEVNNLHEGNPHLINETNTKFRYNNYLQNIEVISFTRHPYYRFLSAYFNKHADRKCKVYIKLDKYRKYLKKFNNSDTIENMIDYLIEKKKYKNEHPIDQHSSPISYYYYNIYKTLEYSIYHIEDGMNEKLDEFFYRFHVINKKNLFLDNSTEKDYNTYKINTLYKKYDFNEWAGFIKKKKCYPNYLSILDDRLKSKLKLFYSEDLEKQRYSDNPELYDGSIKFIQKSLPNDFNVTFYKTINRDLIRLSDTCAKIHYITAGQKEGRLYNWSTLPNDFDVSVYKEINSDLSDMCDIKLKHHYINFGAQEGRLYNFNNLPDGFNVSMYKEYNTDLNILTDTNAKIHYIKHGKFEGRKHHDIHFDYEYFRKANNTQSHIDAYKLYGSDIRKEKNNSFVKYVDSLLVVDNIQYILLVNHNEELYGAPHYLFMLYKLLASDNKYKNIKFILCLTCYKSIIYDKYSIKSDEVVEYKDDPTLLYMLYKKFNPLKIYFNSCNYAISKIYNYIPDNIGIFHSHEIYEHYTLSEQKIPTYVVSDRIANQYINKYNKKPKIILPFVDSIDFILKSADFPIDEKQIKNNVGFIDTNKITIGMCGQITTRKNYNLFIEVSKVYPNYNFVWIGGDNGSVFDAYDNIYFIPFQTNPYKYFKQLIDYFILFSLQDPCPYVILENILLSSNIITFSDNIYTDHKNVLTNDFYFEYNGSINKETCIDAINKFVKHKKIFKYTSGQKYIENNFVFNKATFYDVLSLNKFYFSSNELSIVEKNMIMNDIISYTEEQSDDKETHDKSTIQNN
jgi:hypothetical protein